jgi:hypothetical protein
MPERAAGKRLTAQTFLLSEFLLKHASERVPMLSRRALVQAHCHHKSLGFEAEKKIFEKMGLEVERPPSGCCGLAGSFGFEAEKYDVSSACGERVILPAVRKAEDEVLILADGFSCRTQIESGTGRRPLHLAEALQLALGPALPAGRVEAALSARRTAAVERSIGKARLAFVTIALLVVAAIVAANVVLRSNHGPEHQGVGSARGLSLR